MGKKIIARNEAQVNNDDAALIAQPFKIAVRIQGVHDILFHRWSDEAVAEKAASAKGSISRKTDDIEHYVYRDENDYICLPGRYLMRALQEAGLRENDPSVSKQKTARDIVKASLMTEEMYSPILVGGKPTKEWDYEDRQRVCIMRASITRTRPAFKKGWEAEFNILNNAPHLLDASFIRRLVDTAGLLIGVGDFRPSYGRFKVISWEEVPSAYPI